MSLPLDDSLRMQGGIKHLVDPGQVGVVIKDGVRGQVSCPGRRRIYGGVTGDRSR